jgi:UDP-4-amino-4-deoxy-L-arabinose formyltransferase/UDP-glucuronic acid dehydrogenase (UDP-4-keto-hexauronic acid decarboxylating)
MADKIKVVVCGEKWVAQKCLDFLYEEPKTEICAIVTSSTTDWQTDLAKWGAKRGIKVFLGNVNNYVNDISSFQPDLIFSIQYRLLIKPIILRISRHCINLHFGLLPRYGGCHPIAWAILNGEKQAGVTLHEMSEKFDEGDIFGQLAVPITETTTARELFDAVSEIAVELFIKRYAAICEGCLKTYPQDLSQKLYYSKNSIDFEKDKIINWHKTGIEIQRHICAFSFQPFQLPTSYIQLPTGKHLEVTISQTRLLKTNELLQPGIMKIINNEEILVGTGSDKVIQIGFINKQKPLSFLNSLGYSLSTLTFI